LKQSSSQTHHDMKPSSSSSSSSVRQPWKQSDHIEEPTVSSKSESTSTNCTHILDVLQDYDHVCAKCNMPFISQSSLIHGFVVDYVL
jgi:hypothetical protein